MGWYFDTVKLNRPIELAPGELPDGLCWSEKIDGFRCIWTGSEFQSRDGNRFNVPRSWLDAMPAQPLDGELFVGSWSKTASAIKLGDWSGVRFWVFDSPVAGNLGERLTSVPELPDFCVMLEHEPVFSQSHLDLILANIQRDGGEGVVLRSMNDDYAGAWFKVKPVTDDEGTVIAPRFRTYNTIPSGYLLNWNGREVIATACGYSRYQPGDVVTFKFNGLDAEGNPRRARVKGQRMFD